jgi:colanic acid biosynthesis glycosyl transferase WcaI
LQIGARNGQNHAEFPKMRFLILTQYFPPEIGAAPTRLSALIRQLRNAGHDVEVVTAFPNYPTGKIAPEYQGMFFRSENRENVVVHRTWLYATAGGGLPRLLNYLTFAVTSLWGLARATKPDFLFVESPPLFLTPTAYFYSRLRNVPLILNVADLWPDAVIEMGLLKKGLATEALSMLERWSYRQATYVNAITEGIRATLVNQKHLAPEKVLYLPNGVDTDYYQPGLADEKLKQVLKLSGKKIVLYAGTLGRAHGLENVLSAAQMLAHQPEVHFLFLGDGSERPRLEKLRDEMQLNNVSFHDFVPVARLHSFYSIADCGLASLLDIPIFDSARPSKIFAVLASGKPMIYFGKGEGARLVQSANAGVVVQPEDSAALAQAVSGLLSNPALIRELGANGRKYVEDNYEWSKLVNAWVSTLPQPLPASTAFASHG